MNVFGIHLSAYAEARLIFLLSASFSYALSLSACANHFRFMSSSSSSSLLDKIRFPLFYIFRSLFFSSRKCFIFSASFDELQYIFCCSVLLYQCIAKYAVVAFYCCYLKCLFCCLEWNRVRWRHIPFYLCVYLQFFFRLVFLLPETHPLRVCVCVCVGRSFVICILVCNRIAAHISLHYLYPASSQPTSGRRRNRMPSDKTHRIRIYFFFRKEKNGI